VLDLAGDANVPLLERVRFSAIFSLFMDEFLWSGPLGCAARKSRGRDEIAGRSPPG
jgi:polyphosphate kinase